MCCDFNSNFQILEKIGEGTFSEVLKCRKLNTGQVFAVKKLKKDYTTVRESQNNQELVLLQNLPPHPNVLSLVDSLYDPKIGKIFMIFELMEMNLYELLQRRKRCLPESKVKHLFFQILKGLDHLHSHGVFHRDIKPENILIKKASVKLADMGSVRGINSPMPYTEYISTRWYRAPECILTSGIYGPKMDIWACGCVFFELLTSKPMFPGADEIDQLTRIHQVVGTPTPRVLLKMRRGQSRVSDVKFAPYPSINFAIVLPFTTDSARDLLKRMLMYDPDLRANVRRLLDHKYFSDLREVEFLKRVAQNTITQKQWHNPLPISNAATKKPKPRSIMSNLSSIDKKKGQEKLVSNSWGPTTKTSKVNMVKAKSKPYEQLSPTRLSGTKNYHSTRLTVNPCLFTSDTVQKKQECSLKSPTKKKPSNSQSSKASTKIPIKLQKANTAEILPGIMIEKRSTIKVSKSQASGVTSFRPLGIKQKFLPPIQE